MKQQKKHSKGQTTDSMAYNQAQNYGQLYTNPYQTNASSYQSDIPPLYQPIPNNNYINPLVERYYPQPPGPTRSLSQPNNVANYQHSFVPTHQYYPNYQNSFQ
jgi:hypothetical protein